MRKRRKGERSTMRFRKWREREKEREKERDKGDLARQRYETHTSGTPVDCLPSMLTSCFQL